MSRQRSSIQLITALVLALAAGVLVYKWMQTRPEARVTDPMDSQVMIAVAAHDLTRGQGLSDKDVRLAPRRVAELPVHFFRDASVLTGRVTTAEVPEGQALTDALLAPETVTAGGVSAMIAPGMRAIAVQGNKVMGISGFVHPGTRVDVLATLDVPDGSRNKPVTKVVLEHVKVLATGTRLEPAGPDGETSPVDVYTLELSPDQSERLALAATQGTLHFAMRNPTDDSPAGTGGMDMTRMLAGLGGPSDSGPKAVAAPHRDRRIPVEVIRGLERDIVRLDP